MDVNQYSNFIIILRLQNSTLKSIFLYSLVKVEVKLVRERILKNYQIHHAHQPKNIRISFFAIVNNFRLLHDD